MILLILLARSCEVDPSVCDINAGCVAQPQGHRCVCNPGYDGDGSQCLPQGSEPAYRK